MYFIIYETTNLVDGKRYIGAHKTESLEDGYLGSGKHLKRAIRKYGEISFKRKILHILESEEDMYKKELELVTKEFVADPMTYNLKVGGSGGNPGLVGAFKGRKHSNETIELLRSLSTGKTPTEYTCIKLKETHWSKTDPVKFQEHVSKIGSKPKTEEHKKRISESLKGKSAILSKVKCPHCSKTGAMNLMKRWHFDKCKQIPV